MSIRKTFLLRDMNELTPNKALVLGMKESVIATQGTTPIKHGFTIRIEYNHLAWAVATRHILANGEVKYIHHKYITATTNGITISYPSEYANADGIVYLEMMPTGVQRSSSGQIRQISFTGGDILTVDQLPEHPGISGIRFSHPNSFSPNLHSVTAVIPDSYTTATEMFLNCTSLVNITVGTPRAVSDFSRMFEKCTLLGSTDGFRFEFDGSKSLHLPNFGSTFINCPALTFNSFKGGHQLRGRDYSYMFHGCIGLTNIPPEAENLFIGTENSFIPNMNFNGMFMNCYNLRVLPRFTTAPNSDCNFVSMFSDCINATTTNMQTGRDWRPSTSIADSMFKGCKALVLDQSFKMDLRINRGTGFGVFRNCFLIDPDVTNLFVKGAALTTTAGSVDTFSGCHKLTFTGSSNWDITVGGVSTRGMFQTCQSINHRNADWSNVKFLNTITNTSYMFADSNWGVELEDMYVQKSFKNWDFSNVTNANQMFYRSKVKNLSAWNADEGYTFLSFFKGLTSESTAVNTTQMFGYCTELVLRPYGLLPPDAGKLLMKFGDYFGTENIGNASGMFSGCTKVNPVFWEDGDAGLQFNRLLAINSIFSDCTSMVGTGLDKVMLNVTETVVLSTSAFYGCNKLMEIPRIFLNSTRKDPTNRTTNIGMNGMFANCTAYHFRDINTKITLTKLDTDLLVAATTMFANCYQMEDLPMLTFLTNARLTNLTSMFSSCLKLADFTVSNMKPEPNPNDGTVDLTSMFSNCPLFKGTDMHLFFSMLNNQIHKVKLTSTFSGCNEFNGRLNEESLDKGIRFYGSMDGAFRDCYKFTGAGLRYANVNGVTSFGDTFYKCRKLNFIPNDSMIWHAPLCVSATRMLYECTELSGIGFEFLFNKASSIRSLIGFAYGTTKWEAPLTKWCVSMITSLPNDFATNSPFLSQTANQPVWGTCPTA